MAATPAVPATTPALSRVRRDSRPSAIPTMAIPPAAIAAGASQGRKLRYPDHS